MKNIFQYGEKEVEYLKSVDPVLGEIIYKIGHIEREIIPDLFASLVRSLLSKYWQEQPRPLADEWRRNLK